MYLTRNVAARCVMARIRRQGKLYQSNFTLRQFATWENAERAAADWVAQTLRTLPPPDKGRGRLTRRNATGIVGVHQSIDPAPPGSDRGDYSSYHATWVDFEGKRRSVRFSCERYGDAAALRMAALARELRTGDRQLIQQRYRAEVTRSARSRSRTPAST